ncbi:FecCD family ABC transporter permease [Deinococcus cellulosilyticus]|uniref:ABC transporter permease n=1 Tax=Deinococcus cellulosilyticus (strain DSM 18568 / NBRC 106333 / KACC 11606 / 5516J-15) TaxID=1223518 RepID=A0A511N1Q6_DEIC1|nr:iron ABC transporter permease [Deinococcus cellulosilyticus]GEM46388.1 ABC transporter permease [Deinococcus cellulosilyticus NBRC 106333 = KACC 11606]
MTTLTASAPHKRQKLPALLILPLLLVSSLILAIGTGAVSISPLQVISIFLTDLGLSPLVAFEDQQAAVLHAIRLPRVLLGALMGAALAVCGAAMQGLFRNPLADPGLLGISSGASLAVAGTVVLGLHSFGLYSLQVAAFVGSMVTTAVIYLLSQEQGRVNVMAMLLSGIAINALCGAGTGLFTFLSTDEQLKSITFWQLGSLGGATWETLMVATPFLLISVMLMPFLASSFNALSLGEQGARHLGIPVDALKWVIVTLVALGVGAGVAVSGMIGFVGLTVPHLIRLWLGPNHRVLFPASALLGASLLVLADLAARTIAIPAEVPIGIVTALIGAPFFLYLLNTTRKAGKL